MFFSQAVAVGDVGVVNTVQGHVHVADAQHGWVKVKPVEHAAMEMLTLLLITEQLGVVVAQIFARRDQETTGASGRVADHVLRRWLGHFHH